MPHHGETNNETKTIYCGYWMTIEEWEDIHSYDINENFEESNNKIEQKIGQNYEHIFISVEITHGNV